MKIHSVLVLLAVLCVGGLTLGHIVPPEELVPVAESHRRLCFLLRLNPVPWDAVARDADVIGRGLRTADSAAGQRFAAQVNELLDAMAASGEAAPAPTERRAASRRLFESSTRAVARILRGRLDAAAAALDRYAEATAELEAARGIWAAFAHEVRYTDPQGFRRLGESWLELNMSLGHPGVLGVGRVEPDREAFERNAAKVASYVRENFEGEKIESAPRRFAAVPARSATYEATAELPPKLPPGSNINKQLPRPRQVLNMATRGVDESETVLIALGDMAFDSQAIFGEPARSFGMTCNTCHNKSITNPGFFIPGISGRKGGLDVSNNYFAPHANNGHFDPLDIPDLRGIRFTAPYGRNGRFDSLREFVRNVIVNEFNGPEPEPMLLDGLVAYMLEFDFLPNPYLGPDGRLTDKASEAARRGEKIFGKPFANMGDRSCASCHIPSDNFVDRKRHDVGTVRGAEEHSRDGSLDTPTLLSIAYTAPYFHDGSAPTLRAVNEWFNRTYRLGLDEQALSDLTAYVETVGYGSEAYEDTLYTLEAELEEFSFFLSTHEFLDSRGQRGLMDLNFLTIAYEVRAHKWDVQDPSFLPVLDQLARLMDEAHEANQRGDRIAVNSKISEYRALYETNKEHLK
jgi:cytochrome c peroxidase